MHPYVDYVLFSVVVCGLLVAGAVGFLMFRNYQKRPSPVLSERTDCFPVDPLDTPGPIVTRPRKRG